MFQNLNKRMSKCFQKNFDKTCKVSANNFKPFRRLKQNVHRVSTKCKISIKWNTHYLVSITMVVMIQVSADRNIDESYMLEKTTKRNAPFETIGQD